jgi:methylthioribose-1-phosphate isomerase
MKINGQPYRTIWLDVNGENVSIIDQTRLPHEFIIVPLRSCEEAAVAIQTMLVRGAPLIGATAAWGVYLAAKEDASESALEKSFERLLLTRPTAVNLRWALEKAKNTLFALPKSERVDSAKRLATKICEEDVNNCRLIGGHGAEIIRKIWESKGKTQPVNILTHCNAGWLATVDWGTATAPIYVAFEQKIALHVWVDETRPRNQGASLTAWELGQQGVPHTLISDNAGGHLMQSGKVDLVLTGTDRTAANGDVANKIGTYLKALAAYDNNIPFYVGLPSSTIDWNCNHGRDIPIEEREQSEVLTLTGLTKAGNIETINIAPAKTRAANPAFDVTPARLVTGLITERGVCEASAEGLKLLYPEQK